MIPLWTHVDAVKATGGAAPFPWQATGVSIDTRTLQPGDLFIALRGNALDGHAYVHQALKAGAAAVMVDTVPADLPQNAPILKVADTQAALENLGRFSRARCQAKVIAITGSVGKTGTKEMLATCLATLGRTFSTPGNLNNHWGAPLSLTRMPAATEYAIMELGMNHAGEIAPLSKMVQPHVSIITTVEAAHLAHFSGLEDIADAKTEIFQGMSTGSIAILNADNSQFARLRTAAGRSGLRVWAFGSSATADIHLISCDPDSTGSTIHARIQGQSLTYRLSLPGRHLAMNSLAVLAAVKAVGGDMAKASAALSQLSPVQGRGSRMTITKQTGSFTIIDDSYNASPAAVKAALRVLAATPAKRTVAILGDMLELGPQADALHADLAETVAEMGIQQVHCCGPHMKALHNALPATAKGLYAPDSHTLAPMVSSLVQPGDVILVKGSKGSKMDLVIDRLKGTP